MAGGVKKRFGQNKAMSDMANFFQIILVFGQKIHTFEHLKEIWRQLGRTKYLDI